MRKFLRRAFGIATLLYGLVYFLACLTPYVSPITFFPMTFLALGFPYLLCGVVVLIIIWLFIKRKTALILLLLLFVGYKNVFSSFAVSLASNSGGDTSSSLTILAWNVREFDNPSIYSDTPRSIRRQMVNYINASGADILCLQEFADHKGKGMYSNTEEIIKLGYPYHFLTNDIKYHFFWGDIAMGSAIFSKLPLVDSGRTLLGDTSHTEYLEFADVMLNNKRLRVYTTHLKSYIFSPVILDSPSMVSFHGDKGFFYTASKYEKLKAVSQDHVREALITKEEMNKSKYPVVFAADLNDVPASYTYHLLKVGLKDAFLTNGLGLGSTLDSMPPNLRIDCLLTDKRLRVNSYKKDVMHLSDHYPHMINISWE